MSNILYIAKKKSGNEKIKRVTKFYKHFGVWL